MLNDVFGSLKFEYTLLDLENLLNIAAKYLGCKTSISSKTSGIWFVSRSFLAFLKYRQKQSEGKAI